MNELIKKQQEELKIKEGLLNECVKQFKQISFPKIQTLEPNSDSDLLKTKSESHSIDSQYSIKSIKQDFYSKCILSKEDDYICKYLNGIVKQFKLDLSVKYQQIKLEEYVKNNCIKKMKMKDICNKIILSVNSLLQNIYSNTTVTIQNNENDNKQFLKDCKIDYLPNSLTLNTICLSDVIKDELIVRIKNKGVENNDKCLSTFCKKCCSDNSTNQECSICKIIK